MSELEARVAELERKLELVTAHMERNLESLGPILRGTLQFREADKALEDARENLGHREVEREAWRLALQEAAAVGVKLQVDDLKALVAALKTKEAQDAT